MSESHPKPPDLPVLSNGASAAAVGEVEDEEDNGPLTAEKIQRHLWDTVRKGDFVSAWYWLDQGAKADEMNEKHVTPAGIAARSGRVGVLEVMRFYPSFSPNSIGANNDMTLLHMAARANKNLAVRWLLRAGADPAARTRDEQLAGDLTTDTGIKEDLKAAREEQILPTEQAGYLCGEQVLCETDGAFWPANVSGTRNAPRPFKVHFLGWKNFQDRWVHPDSMRRVTAENLNTVPLGLRHPSQASDPAAPVPTAQAAPSKLDRGRTIAGNSLEAAASPRLKAIASAASPRRRPKRKEGGDAAGSDEAQPAAKKRVARAASANLAAMIAAVAENDQDIYETSGPVESGSGASGATRGPGRPASTPVGRARAAARAAGNKAAAATAPDLPPYESPLDNGVVNTEAQVPGVLSKPPPLVSWAHLVQRLEYALTGTGLISRLQGTGVTLEQYCQQLERQNHQLQQQLLIKDATLQAVREELGAVRTRELSEATAAGATEGSATTAVRRLKTMLAKANVTIGGMASKNQQLQNHNDELHHILGDEAPAQGGDAAGAAAAAAAAPADGGEEAGAEAE